MFPILEFDPDRSAVIDPTMLIEKDPAFPKVFISCFARVQFDRLLTNFTDPKVIGEIYMANLVTPIYKATFEGHEFGLLTAEVGAPTCVGMFEELFAKGAESLVLYGNCGVLDASIADCAIILPTSAIRDEGTSYHYAPPSESIEVNARYGALFESLLKELGISYHKGITWTADAFYRETKGKVEKRIAQGCITVDMEAASMAALAQFRGKDILQFFYAADNLVVPEWDQRSLSAHDKVEEKDKVGLLAIEAARRILDQMESH